MKKLMAGLGLTVLAVPSAQVWAGSSIEDMRTMQANKSSPIVRVKRSYSQVIPCGHCHSQQARQQRYQQQHRQYKQQQASGWQRGAAVHTQSRRIPAKPVVMHAYYSPQKTVQANLGKRVHRINGPVKNSMCRYG